MMSAWLALAVLAAAAGSNHVPSARLAAPTRVDAEPAPAAVASASDIGRLLTDADPAVRRAAIERLSKDAAHALRALKAAALNDPDAAVRQSAADARAALLAAVTPPPRPSRSFEGRAGPAAAKRLPAAARVPQVTFSTAPYPCRWEWRVYAVHRVAPYWAYPRRWWGGCGYLRACYGYDPTYFYYRDLARREYDYYRLRWCWPVRFSPPWR